VYYGRYGISWIAGLAYGISWIGGVTERQEAEVRDVLFIKFNRGLGSDGK